MPTMRSRVDWGLGLVMLSFCPTMRLSSVDFPTFGFPATVTIPALGITEDTPNYRLAVAAAGCRLRTADQRHFGLLTNYELGDRLRTDDCADCEVRTSPQFVVSLPIRN